MTVTDTPDQIPDTKLESYSIRHRDALFTVFRTTEESIVSSLDAITPGDIGSAGLVTEKKVAGAEMITVSA